MCSKRNFSNFSKNCTAGQIFLQKINGVIFEKKGDKGTDCIL